MIYPSLHAAAGALNIPVDVLKFAKRKGCAAFHSSNRVDGAKLQAWLSDNADALKNKADDHSLRDQKTIEEIRKLKLANDIKENRYTLTADAEAEVSSMARECQRVLYQIPGRLAPELAGLGPVEIESKLNKAIDEAVATIGGK